MTRDEMLDRYKKESLVAQLIERKVREGVYQRHCEFPDDDSMTLYKCWDSQARVL